MSIPPPTRPAERPPQGNPQVIPADLDPHLSEMPSHQQFAVSIVGSAARIAGEWVEVSIQATCSRLGVIPPTSLALPWRNWLDLFRGDAAVKAFYAARDAGWVTISDDGYAAPTQQLADFLCGLEG